MASKMITKMVKEMKIIEICCWFIAVISVLPIIWLIISLINSSVLAEQISFAIDGIAAGGVALLVALIAREVKKTGRPFVKKISIYLDLLQGWVYIVALTPGISSMIQKSMNLANGDFSFRFIAIWFVAVGIGIFTRIYKYGCDLQNDMDTIA